MRVLSLFDGMSCGRIALERADIPVTSYHASEIDKWAIKVSEKNYPDIIRLSDVTRWREWDLPEIDLLMAGSPCQGFSFAGKQLAFNDPRSVLFFEFVDILKATKPKYFLLENVKMKKEFQNVITDILGVEPIEINSNKVSCANRSRLYWTNIKTNKLKGIPINPKEFTDDGVPMTIGSSANRVFKETDYYGALTASMCKGVRAAGRPIVAAPYCKGRHIDDLKKDVDQYVLENSI